MSNKASPPLTLEEEAMLQALNVQDDPERMAAAEQWCVDHPEGRAMFEKALVALNRLDPAARALHRDKLQSETENVSGTIRKQWPMQKLAIAASVMGLIFAGLGVAYWMNYSRTELPDASVPSPKNDLEEPLIFVTQTGEVREITLPDGSRIMLDADTKLQARMDDRLRDLRLDRGRARFTVAHDPARPFVVRVDGAQITALGTIFDVERREACEVRILLLQGKVTVTPPCRSQSASATGIESPLQAGERIRYSASTARDAFVQPEQAPASDSQWVSGLKSYSDVRLAEVIAEVNLYSDRKLIAATPAVADMRVSAELHIRDIESVAGLLGLSLDLTVDKSVPGQIILKQ